MPMRRASRTSPSRWSPEGTGYPDLAYGLQLTTEEYGIGFRKGSDAAAKVNEALKELYDDGTMQSLAETYGIAGAIIAQ